MLDTLSRTLFLTLAESDLLRRLEYRPYLVEAGVNRLARQRPPLQP